MVDLGQFTLTIQPVEGSNTSVRPACIPELRMVQVLAVPEREPVAVRGDVDDPAGLGPGPALGQAGVEELRQEEVTQVVDTEVELSQRETVSRT